MSAHAGHKTRARGLLLALVLLAAAVPSAAFGATPPLSGKVKPPAGGAYVGVYHRDAPFVPSAFDEYRKMAGERPAIVMWYQPWTKSGRYGFSTSACVSCWKRGAIPLITWEPWDPEGDPAHPENIALQSEYALAKINAGVYDDYIRSWARAAKAARGPIMIRLMHEMNGGWYPWGKGVNGNEAWQFRVAWRHVVDIFRQEGAKNVTWVWSPNEDWTSAKTDPFKDYWPGRTYVDWIGVSGYNWGTAYSWSSWRTFETTFHSSLTRLKKYKKPIMIAEMGCTTSGGSQASWIKTTYARIKVHKEVDAVVYYDRTSASGGGTQDFALSTSAATSKAYRKVVTSKYFKGSTPRTLKIWKSKVSAAQLAVLDAIPRTQ